MTTSDHAGGAGRPGTAPSNAAQPNRSEDLLPAGSDDADGRFEVAEEVNLDQQSDAARRIGQAPDDPVPDVPGRPPSGAPGATR